MAGLNNLISNTAQQTTTLPTWFDTAQQNVVSQAGNVLAAAPTPQNTVAQNAVNQLSGPTNAFTNAAGTLQSIASGGANPWITDASGAVKPNTSTALGGLFAAQDQQLRQLMPNVTSAAGAAGIGSGNFGSLRGQTAVNKAIGDAQAQMNASQYQAALQNQANAVNAGQGVGNLTQQGINNLLTVGQYEQASPFTNVSNYGKILGGIQAPTTVTNQTQLSPLNQYAGLYSLLAGDSKNAGLLKSVGTSLSKIPGLEGLAKMFSSSGSGLTSNLNVGTYPLADGGNMVINADGSRVITSADGTVSNFDKNGDPTAPPLSPIPETGLPDTSPGTPDGSGSIPDYTGPAIDNNPTNDAGSPDYSDPGYSDY
jgi:hypothetical protein